MEITEYSYKIAKETSFHCFSFAYTAISLFITFGVVQVCIPKLRGNSL